MTALRSLAADDAARLPLSLRRIARAFLAREHLHAGSALPADQAPAAILAARRATADRAAAEARLTIAWPSGGWVGTVAGGGWVLDLDAQTADAPRVHLWRTRGAGKTYLGRAELGVQFPLRAAEPDFAFPGGPAYSAAERKALQRMRADDAGRRPLTLTLPADLLEQVDADARRLDTTRAARVEAILQQYFCAAPAAYYPPILSA